MINVGDYCLNHHQDISSQPIIIFTSMTCMLQNTQNFINYKEELVPTGAFKRVSEALFTLGNCIQTC